MRDSSLQQTMRGPDFSLDKLLSGPLRKSGERLGNDLFGGPEMLVHPPRLDSIIENTDILTSMSSAA